MFNFSWENLKPWMDWLNANQGVVGVLIFASTLTLGWVSGVFQALRRRPKLHITLIDGPTFCSTFQIGDRYGDFDVHRTAIALYVHIRNRGSASTSIEAVHLGYHWNVIPLTSSWWRYGLGWFWLTHHAVAIDDFQVAIGENLKFYPFLFQKSVMSGTSSETFLKVGQSTNGVIYFEQNDSWGGCSPKVRDGSCRVKICALDAFGKRHYADAKIPFLDIVEARKFNPSFGKTLAELRGVPLPVDREEGVDAVADVGIQSQTSSTSRP
jgi:hypothetical protein